MRLKTLDTEKMSEKYRRASIDVGRREILISYFPGSQQEKDFTEPANCSGLGRIRHFTRRINTAWPSNPLPIDPACRALGLSVEQRFRAQVFQNAVCNWRCWYCFVDFDLLRASARHSKWTTSRQLVDLYLAEPKRPPMIDLTGGQPDLTPEWVVWMMREISHRGMEREVYLWSDDNLSNDYFWRFLSDADRAVIAQYPTYGRVCCFKGFNSESFHFNTQADPASFNRQFELMRRLIDLGIDLYAYVTLTTPSTKQVDSDMETFVDRLQELDANLPLRTVPLEIKLFSPVKHRMNDLKHQSLQNQYRVVQAWTRELERRFSTEARGLSIVDVRLRDRTSG